MADVVFPFGLGFATLIHPDLVSGEHQETSTRTSSELASASKLGFNLIFRDEICLNLHLFNKCPIIIFLLEAFFLVVSFSFFFFSISCIDILVNSISPLPVG